MDFSLTKEQQALLDTARKLGPLLAENAARYDEESAFPAENFDALKEAGLTAMTVPKDYGGHGLWQDGNYLGLYLVFEELAKYCSSTSQLLQVHCHGTGYLAWSGTESQKARYFKEVVEGGKLFASFGSEASVRQTGPEPFDSMVKPTGDKEKPWRLSGYKGFASLAPGADYFAVWSLLEGTSRMAEGMVYAIVPADDPGVRLEDDWHVMGMRPTVSWGVHFDDIRLADDEIVGQPGEWVQDDPRTFSLAFASNHLGTAQGVHDYVLDFVRERPYLRDNPVIQVKLGEFDTMLESTRMLIWRGAWLWEQGQWDAAEHASILALHSAKQTGLAVTNQAFDICGARVAYHSHPIGRAFRDTRTFTLHFREDRYMQFAAQHALGMPFHSKQKYGPRITAEERDKAMEAVPEGMRRRYKAAAE